MKKVLKLQDLDCAACAQKMEYAIKKLDGVEDAQVSFLMQKLTLTAADDRFDDLVKQVMKVCKRVEPDCKILV